MIKEIDYSNELINTRACEWDVKEKGDLSFEIVQDLNDTLKNNGDRLYLCSNEIGYKERAFAIKFPDDIKIYMNPYIQSSDEIKLVREYDPKTKKEYIIPRSTSIVICYQDCIGKPKADKFNVDASVIVHQAMDCLDGLHPEDYGLEILPEFDSATDEERAAVIEGYIKSINEYGNKLDEELGNNPDTKKEWGIFRFFRDKADGKIEFEEDPTNMNRKQRRLFDRLIKKLSKKKRGN